MRGPNGPRFGGPRFGSAPDGESYGDGPGGPPPGWSPGRGRGPGGFGPRGFGPRGFGRGFGPGGFGPGGFGPGGPADGPDREGHGHGHGPGRGRRQRGNVRAAVLALLAEQPQHGYAIMTELSERSGGLWRPSPGSVYPVLQQLQDEALVTAEESGGRRVFSLTDTGREYVATHPDEVREPWKVAEAGPRERVRSLMHAGAALAVAVQQVARLSDDAQAARALEVLEGARRSMYRILAGDDPAAAGETGPGSAGPGPESAR